MAPFATNSNIYLSPSLSSPSEPSWAAPMTIGRQRYSPLLMVSPGGVVTTALLLPTDEINDGSDFNSFVATTATAVDDQHGSGGLPPVIQRVDAFDEWDQDDSEDEVDQYNALIWSPPTIQRACAFDEWDDEEGDSKNDDEANCDAGITSPVKSDTIFTFDFASETDSAVDTNTTVIGYGKNGPDGSWMMPESRRRNIRCGRGSNDNNIDTSFLSPSPLITSITALEGDNRRHDHYNFNEEGGHTDEDYLQLPSLDHDQYKDEKKYPKDSRRRLIMGSFPHQSQQEHQQQEKHAQEVLFDEHRLEYLLLDLFPKQVQLERHRALFIMTDEDGDHSTAAPSTPCIPEVIIVQKELSMKTTMSKH